MARDNAKLSFLLFLIGMIPGSFGWWLIYVGINGTAYRYTWMTPQVLPGEAHITAIYYGSVLGIVAALVWLFSAALAIGALWCAWRRNPIPALESVPAHP